MITSEVGDQARAESESSQRAPDRDHDPHQRGSSETEKQTYHDRDQAKDDFHHV